MLGMFLQKLDERLNDELNRRIEAKDLEFWPDGIQRERENVCDEILDRLFVEIGK